MKILPFVIILLLASSCKIMEKQTTPQTLRERLTAMEIPTDYSMKYDHIWTGLSGGYGHIITTATIHNETIVTFTLNISDATTTRICSHRENCPDDYTLYFNQQGGIGKFQTMGQLRQHLLASFSNSATNRSNDDENHDTTTDCYNGEHLCFQKGAISSANLFDVMESTTYTFTVG